MNNVKIASFNIFVDMFKKECNEIHEEIHTIAKIYKYRISYYCI